MRNPFRRPSPPPPDAYARLRAKADALEATDPAGAARVRATIVRAEWLASLSMEELVAEVISEQMEEGR